MVLNDAGVIGLSLNGKSFPATAPVMRQAGRLGRDQLLQRGPADPPDAPARAAAARDRRRTASRCRSPYTVDTLVGRAGRALHGARARRPPTTRASGRSTATSSPTPRATTACSAWSRRSSSSDGVLDVWAPGDFSDGSQETRLLRGERRCQQQVRFLKASAVPSWCSARRLVRTQPRGWEATRALDEASRAGSQDSGACIPRGARSVALGEWHVFPCRAGEAAWCEPGRSHQRGAPGPSARRPRRDCLSPDCNRRLRRGMTDRLPGLVARDCSGDRDSAVRRSGSGSVLPVVDMCAGLR